MFAGILNEKIEIWRSTTTRNSYGEEEAEWVKSSSIRAGVSHSSTSRTVINYEIQYPYQKFFIVRKYADVKEDDRIKYDGQFFIITSIEWNREKQCKKINVEVLNE